jgi:hypothetical protein
MREGLGDAPRATRGSVGRLATGARTQMPPGLQGHRLQYDGPKNRKCMNCGTKSWCGCGRAIFGVSKGVTCWAWHLDMVMMGDVDEEPVRWQRGKRIRGQLFSKLN